MEEKDRQNQENEQGQPGIPVDRYGGATVDPTKNVLDLVQAAVKRLDDLAEVKNKKIEEKLSDEKIHIREILSLTREYEDKLKVAEAKRIDSIRSVDVQAVQTANEKATAAAQVLATNVTTSAETLRALVATSATATAAQLTQIITPITDRLALLEKNQYQGAGKESVTDPMMQQLLAEMKATRESVGKGEAKTQGSASTIMYIIVGIGAISTILSIVATIISLS